MRYKARRRRDYFVCSTRRCQCTIVRRPVNGPRYATIFFVSDVFVERLALVRRKALALEKTYQAEIERFLAFLDSLLRVGE